MSTKDGEGGNPGAVRCSGDPSTIMRVFGPQLLMSLSVLCWETIEFLDSWGSMVARLKLKEIDGRALPGVELAV